MSNPFAGFFNLNNAPVEGQDFVEIEVSRADIEVFVETLYGHSDGFIPLRAFPEKGTDTKVTPRLHWVPNDDKVVDAVYAFAQECAKNRMAAYVIPGTVAEYGQAKADQIRETGTILIDIDAGNVDEKLAAATEALGEPSLIVESGGRTEEGYGKIHVYWKLDESMWDEDVKTASRVRHELAIKLGTDTAFQSPHQPIRIAGSIHGKNGIQRRCSIRKKTDVEYRLEDLVARSAALKPLAVAAKPVSQTSMFNADGGFNFNLNNAPVNASDVQEVLTTVTHEGGVDGRTRFEALSKTIGYWLRRAHEGKMPLDKAVEEIKLYNEAAIRPPWDDARLNQEINALWSKHVKENGEAVRYVEQMQVKNTDFIPFSTLYNDISEDDPDLVGPGLLDVGGFMLLAGPPKSMKSMLLQWWLERLAVGEGFFGFAPERPLRIAYVQAEMTKKQLKKRMKMRKKSKEELELLGKNFLLTDRFMWPADEEGSNKIINMIDTHFGKDTPPDVIVFDPLANIFDGKSENDNVDMKNFLTKRIEYIRNAVNPDAGVILVHHANKVKAEDMKSDPFNAIRGASSLRGYYSSAVFICKLDLEGDDPTRRIWFDFRSEEPPAPKDIELRKDNGEFVEKAPPKNSQESRAEKDRNFLENVILGQSEQSMYYTPSQFAETYGATGGMGSAKSIKKKLLELAKSGVIKFFDGSALGLEPVSKRDYGYIWVPGLRHPNGDTEDVDQVTGEYKLSEAFVKPTHFLEPVSSSFIPLPPDFAQSLYDKRKDLN
ncbi:AAA family ATPase [Roseibium aggregatum]|uniref:AAA domain-containing protein n=1 Tax=Roseibium aggregatum TaxID=187304 RepID=A0A0M6Y6G2_9HYPH|nr:AAA family ATPase [Roseibium aggregatum]CTQ45685.1 hypothetical protein LAL4801_04140 [Roseibium aggregatum]